MAGAAREVRVLHDELPPCQPTDRKRDRAGRLGRLRKGRYGGGRGGGRHVSLTGRAASAYKDDGFVNYGAHGDDSRCALLARCTDTRRSRSRPALPTKTSSFPSRAPRRAG